MVTDSMKQNAHKIAYLVEQYPEKNMTEIISLVALAPIDTNTAIWFATSSKILEMVDRVEEREVPDPADPEGKKTIKKEVTIPYGKVVQKPTSWHFGEQEEDLENIIAYAFEKINADENDMEENYLSNWTMGYLSHDVLIAVKRLLEKEFLHEYEIEDGENVYIFYTLFENKDKVWGQKQFKKNPLTDEKTEAVEGEIVEK